MCFQNTTAVSELALHCVLTSPWFMEDFREGDIGSWVLDGPLDFSPTHRVSRNPDQLCRDGHVHPSMLAFGCPPPNTHAPLLWTILESFMSLIITWRNQQRKKSKWEQTFCILLCPECISHLILTVASGVFMLRTLCTQTLITSNLFHGYFLALKFTLDCWLSEHPTSFWKL